MKAFAVLALIANVTAQEVEFKYNTYGPYSITHDKVGERAFGRPSDASLRHDGYGDSAGVSTGTLYQRLGQISNQDVEFKYNTYGPYSITHDKVGERAFGRPSDESLKHYGYGDSAGVSTGTLYQRLVQEEPKKEQEHTDRTYGPYFDDSERDGHPVALGDSDGRNKEIPYGPYAKPEVGKNGSPVLPNEPRPEDVHKPFPQYQDVGGQGGFIYIPEESLYLATETPVQSYQEKADSLAVVKQTVATQLKTMDDWQAQHAAAMQQWKEDAKFTWDVNHHEIKNTYEFD